VIGRDIRCAPQVEIHLSSRMSNSVSTLSDTALDDSTG
jgi:hypothetical protein